VKWKEEHRDAAVHVRRHPWTRTTKLRRGVYNMDMSCIRGKQPSESIGGARRRTGWVGGTVILSSEIRRERGGGKKKKVEGGSIWGVYQRDPAHEERGSEPFEGI